MHPDPSLPERNTSHDRTQDPASRSTHAPTQQADPGLVASPEDTALIVVHSSEDLVAAVPYLVGFPPEQSLVVVAMRRSGRRQRLGLVARFDLPPVGPRRVRG